MVTVSWEVVSIYRSRRISGSGRYSQQICDMRICGGDRGVYGGFYMY